MGYLLAEIVLYLVGAGLIGFVVGWFVRGEFMAQPVEKNEENIKVVSKEKSEKKEETLIEKEVEPAKVIEVDAKEEVAEETLKEETKPTLFTEVPVTGKDKLSTIKGIGPVLEKKLNELGVYSFEQIASWDAAQEIWIGTQMAFPKRVSKEEWVKQAKELLK